jgi:riboflavin biosynthesis pyrimidine reductase
MMLTEGGPRLLGQLAASGLLDELFLTISPVLAGRGDTGRPGLVAGLELLPGRSEPAELLTVRRHGSYLFLRYATRGRFSLPKLAMTAFLQGSCRLRARP